MKFVVGTALLEVFVKYDREAFEELIENCRNNAMTAKIKAASFEPK